MSKLNNNTLLSRSTEVIFNTLDDEIIMMSEKNGEYYGLDLVGSWIWEKLEEPQTFEELIKATMQEFEVSEEECISDVSELLEAMNEKELILFE